MSSLARVFGRAFLDVLFPPACAACGVVGVEPFCALCAAGLSIARPFSLPGIAEARACFEYGGPAAQAIFRLKYGKEELLARPLGDQMRTVQARMDPSEVVVPIPLAPRRLRERGFNQARVLANRLAGPIDPTLLVREGGGPPQAALVSRERRAQVAGAFSVAPGRTLEGRSFLLADDVVTTGSTVLAAAQALRARGAARVSVLCFLRTGKEAG